MLGRCLGGETQNNNEAFNGTVWNMVPKHIFSGKEIVEFSTKLAACIFNEGCQTILKCMEVMGIQLGREALSCSNRRDAEHIKKAEKKTLNSSKEARIRRRSDKSEDNDLLEQVEGLIYGPGIDD